MKLLIVEPDMMRQRQLRTILTSLGHKSVDIEAVGDGKSAVNLIKKKKIECTFISMGETIDAVQIINDVRSSPSTKNLGMVVFSVNPTKDSVMAATQAGASSFLAYPFSVNDVENAVVKATGVSKP
jgi:CheY-like chemotaxis protein